eukprot:CAMPEP_0202445492 /NCGR_PEP_ID=MMETSP1360-20130828/4309_1 /ASSEMBLY_ACC=CAM_ASM_000848 /TAXON_ID=515479 /ORGANISM="Licmophora paradoxa, Strain CCMP2313" /LENGTH=270 /DNA_ID=CAMNT_0049061789 /DNA_START=302 /DNA_END=1114 /DNA_ORIENTATION=-
MANIVEKEIGQDGVNWEDDIPLSPSLEDLPFQLSSSILPSDGSQSLKKYSMRSALTTLQDDSSWKRIRTVSMDARDENTPRATSPRLSPRLSSKTAPSLVSPVGSPLQSRGRSLRKPKSVSIKKKPQMIPPSSPRTRSLQPKEAVKGSTVKTILRKKFSWKNFPELEAFLIANREEYLRHSALNYTVQQKQYNNKLTERLLELAAEHGYVFDEGSFSFVTVRDRIRCYFKSYVQSAKKRGVIIGYAARKAGLLTEDDLEGASGRIVVPRC